MACICWRLHSKHFEGKNLPWSSELGGFDKIQRNRRRFKYLNGSIFHGIKLDLNFECNIFMFNAVFFAGGSKLFNQCIERRRVFQ